MQPQNLEETFNSLKPYIENPEIVDSLKILKQSHTIDSLTTKIDSILAVEKLREIDTLDKIWNAIFSDAGIITILVAIVTLIITNLFTARLSKSREAREISLLQSQLDDNLKKYKELKSENDSLQRKATNLTTKIDGLNIKANKLDKIRNNLKGSSIVKTFEQPVILVGPRGVGKTSLLMQLYSPWEDSKLSATQTHSISKVPIFDYKEKNIEPHFADPEIKVAVHTHLVLNFHDFPGELSAQKLIAKTVIEETEHLRNQSGMDLGVVLICLFDSEEAKTRVSTETKNYYNGDLFNQLRTLIGHGKVSLERLILVFNKYDNLRRHYDHDVEDTELLKLCVDKFEPVYDLLTGICNREKVCEVFSILSRDQMHFKNRGAPIILGEASRAFVESFVGKEAAEQLIKKPATTYSAEKFL